MRDRSGASLQERLPLVCAGQAETEAAPILQQIALGRAGSGGTVLAGSTVKVGLTGPYGPGVTGSIHGHWLVFMRRVTRVMWGCSSFTIVSIQSMEVQMRANSGFTVSRISETSNATSLGTVSPVEPEPAVVD